MAKFHLELDKRVILKENKYNLSVRLGRGNDNIYLKILPMTEDQYEKVFVKETMDRKSVDLRKQANEFKLRCVDFYTDMNPFDKKKYRNLVYGKLEEKKEIKVSLKLINLVDRYFDSGGFTKLHTKDLYKTAINKINSYKPNLTILDITPSFLAEFEKAMLDKEMSPFTIASYIRHLRSMINHFTRVDKIIPPEFKYPFGKYGGYIIRKGMNLKLVMPNEEIKKVIEFNEFETKEQEYAKDMWVMSYWCNGMNFADLFRLKRANIHNDLIRCSRMKTENTTRNYARDMLVPVFPRLKELIEKVSVKQSPFILGKLEVGYDEETFRSRKEYQLAKIRAGLVYISEKLNLSVPLRMKTARDCYSETLRRAGHSADIRDEMMGHVPASLMAAHYCGVIDKEWLFEINSCLIGINC